MPSVTLTQSTVNQQGYVIIVVHCVVVILWYTQQWLMFRGFIWDQKLYTAIVTAMTLHYIIDRWRTMTSPLLA